MFATIMIGLSIILAVVGVYLWRRSNRKLLEVQEAARNSTANGLRRSSGSDEDGPRFGRVIGLSIAGVGVVLGAIFGLTSTLVPNGVGEAKVYTNVDGTIAFTQTEPGLQVKAPWINYQDFDLFSQELVFAGNQNGTPQYSGGTVTGFEITSAVARGAQTNFDMTVTYSLNSDYVEDIFREYRNQERFTKLVIEKTVLSVARDVPPSYTPVEFRGEKRGEAGERMQQLIADRLADLGVEDVVVNLQSIRYSAETEQSITLVETAQQKEEEAAANLRATEISAQAQIVEAEAKAQAEIAAAAGTAEANRLLTQSLTPEVLTNKYLEAIKNGSTFVVPEGSTPFITVQPSQ